MYKSLETEEAVSPSDGDEEGRPKGSPSCATNATHQCLKSGEFQQVLQVSPLSSFHEVTVYGDPHPAMLSFLSPLKPMISSITITSHHVLNQCILTFKMQNITAKIKLLKSQHNKILLTKKMEMSRIALLIMTFPVMFPLFAHLKFMEMNHLDAGPIVPTATAIIAPEAVHVAERPITNWGLEIFTIRVITMFRSTDNLTATPIKVKEVALMEKNLLGNQSFQCRKPWTTSAAIAIRQARDAAAT
ncbi:hypothetical protein Prudu_013932 [Prunus dulcis]|uniref:Uncharacterized protein n=1 Tax=Prunus dulcis TaxID=3755 RepID=A0A4Y1RGF7_PRUDU|nr:hypothetical protein Prudu_013932 [Prunus dulcis]